MQDVVKDYRRSFGTYAEPLSGLRVSWGSVLAGATALLAVSSILLALAIGVVSILSHPTVASLKGGAIARWICGMAATLVGAFVGGWLAGYLPGSARPGIGVVHGFLAWALALVVSLGFQLFILRATLGAAANTAIETAVALETAAPAAHDEGPSADAPSPYRARDSSRADQARGDAAAVGRTAINYVAGVGWSWFGTWFVAGTLAIAGAGASVRRLRHTDFPNPPVYERERPIGPLTPARSA
jgi:hypothetical protein